MKSLLKKSTRDIGLLTLRQIKTKIEGNLELSVYNILQQPSCLVQGELSANNENKPEEKEKFSRIHLWMDAANKTLSTSELRRGNISDVTCTHLIQTKPSLTEAKNK